MALRNEKSFWREKKWADRTTIFRVMAISGGVQPRVIVVSTALRIVEVTRRLFHTLLVVSPNLVCVRYRTDRLYRESENSPD